MELQVQVQPRVLLPSGQGFKIVKSVMIAEDPEVFTLPFHKKKKSQSLKICKVTCCFSIEQPPLFCPVQAVTLGCAHSFCNYCIGQWRKRRDECPICRQLIQSQTRCLALDNCIDSMVENLSSDMKARRRKLIAERKGERCVCHLKITYALTLSSLRLRLVRCYCRNLVTRHNWGCSDESTLSIYFSIKNRSKQEAAVIMHHK